MQVIAADKILADFIVAEGSQIVIPEHLYHQPSTSGIQLLTVTEGQAHEKHPSRCQGAIVYTQSSSLASLSRAGFTAQLPTILAILLQFH